MVQQQEGEPPPGSTDLDGWGRMIRGGRLHDQPMEAIVAAIQDLGVVSNSHVINALALHASNVIMRRLRRLIGTNHPNRGEDIIYETHGQLIEAILSPESADGKGLREAFSARLQQRAIDALRRAGKKKQREQSVEDVDSAVTPHRVDGNCKSRERTIDDRICVEQVLSRVTDERKRLAFRLHIDGATPPSIAKALGIDPKTARSWLEEIKEQIQRSEREQS